MIIGGDFNGPSPSTQFGQQTHDDDDDHDDDHVDDDDVDDGVVVDTHDDDDDEDDDDWGGFQWPSPQHTVWSIGREGWGGEVEYDDEECVTLSRQR